MFTRVKLLGGQYQTIDQTYDLNNVTSTGIVYTWGTNPPQHADNHPYGSVFNRVGGGNAIHQIMAIRTNQGTQYYFRIRESGNWSSWKRNYDATILEDSTTLSSLASALGERGNLYKKLNGNENFDDIVINGFYNYNLITNFSGKPESLSSPSASFVLIVQQFDGITAHQILILTDAEGMYTRYKRSSGIWTNWVSH